VPKRFLHRAIVIMLVTAMPFLDGCHICRRRQVTASFTGAIAVEGQSTQTSLSGGASESTIGTQYDRLARVVSDASTAGVAQTVIWTLEPGGTGVVDFLAVQMPLPVQRGASMSVVLAARMGGWGTTPVGPREPLPGTPADVYLAKAGFVATSADGNLLVLDTSPLRLRIDVAFHAEDGRTVTVAGEVPFRVIDERDVCGFQ
jgi:hypothetical protein